jgi:NAD(P)-dependent dehydrogenase (short-subunit alcohol dehydrogenase family)
MMEGVDMKQLENKWALITGSSRGIGQQIAIGLAQLKCNIIVHGREVNNVSETLNKLSQYDVQTFAVEGDLEGAEAIEKIIESVNGGPGVVDILYNNAAVQNKWSEIWEIGLDEWLWTFQVNLFAMILLCNAFAPEM